MTNTVRTFVREDDKPSKIAPKGEYWMIGIDDKEYTVVEGNIKSGKIDWRTRFYTKEYESDKECQKNAEEAIKEKLGEGYVEKELDWKTIPEYDFEQMESGLVADNPDEEDEIREGMERLKAMSVFKIQAIVDDWVAEYYEHLLDINDSGADEYAKKEMLTHYYLPEHPEESEDDYDSDAFADFCGGDESEHGTAKYIYGEHVWDELILKAIQDGYAVRDNVYDEASRMTTDSTAEAYELHREIIRALYPDAL